MDATISEMPVEVGLVAVTPDQLLELAKVLAQVFRLDRRVFPAHHRVRFVGVQAQRGRRSAGFTNGPDAVHQAFVCHQPCTRPPRQLRRDGHGPLRQCGGLLGGQRTEFDHQPGVACRQLRDIGKLHAACLEPADDAIVQPLHGNRAQRQQLWHRVGGVVDFLIAQHNQYPVRGVLHQQRLGLQDSDTGSLHPHQRPGDVKAVFRQQLVEVVP